MNILSNSDFHYWGAHIAAIAALLLFIILSIAPVNFGLFHHTRPMLLIMAVFYWSLFRPSFLGYLSLFIIGLIYDSFTLGLFGQTALTLIGLRFIVLMQRRLLINQPFWMIWIVFSVLALASAGFYYILQMIFEMHLLSPMRYLSDAVFSAILFPLIAAFLKPTAEALKTAA